MTHRYQCMNIMEIKGTEKYAGFGAMFYMELASIIKYCLELLPVFTSHLVEDGRDFQQALKIRQMVQGSFGIGTQTRDDREQQCQDEVDPLILGHWPLA